MTNMHHDFLKDEAGAVTIDWVILTAAIITLVIGSFHLISTATISLSEVPANQISSITP